MNINQGHYRSLENMYGEAPINKVLPTTVVVSHGLAVVNMEIHSSYYHAASSLHGCIYFKLLDDAAYFAASSLEMEYFLLTSSFNLYFIRPVKVGKVTTRGRVIEANRKRIIAESTMFDSNERQVAMGNGVFQRGRDKLANIESFQAKIRN